MSMQKVVFLHCSPQGEEYLQKRLAEVAESLSPEEWPNFRRFFGEAVYKQDDGRSVRVWFRCDLGESTLSGRFLGTLLNELSVDDFFFVRFGEEDGDYEAIGNYALEYFTDDEA